MKNHHFAKEVFFVLLLTLLSGTAFSQGAGSRMLYNGTSNYTEIPDDPLFSSQAGGEISVEAWVNVASVNTDGHAQTRQPIVVKGNGGSWEWALYIYDNLRVGFSTWQCSGSGHSEINGGSIALGEWHHVAASFDDNNFNRVYIDGILVSTGTTFSGTACNGARPVRIGSREDGQFLNAQIDEVRIWNRALTQAEIRNNMCQKLAGTEANLTAYYRFDEGADNVCGATQDLCDLTSNNFHGTNTNSPAWGTSGAAIGDASVRQYPFTTTLSLTSTNRGNFSIESPAGSPSGAHVYRVDMVPNSTTGIPMGLGSNNVYYGTFIVGGTAPTYTSNYVYTNYPDAVADETNLILLNRDDNADASWANMGATLNTGTDQLQATLVSSRGEFIIASSNGALPVELLYFDAKIVEEDVVLSWSTVSEVDNDYFTVERSADGLNWKAISQVKGAGNTTNTTLYKITDEEPLSGISYYRLKQTDFDGAFEYFDIKPIDFLGGSISIYPNPTGGQATIVDSKNTINDWSILNTIGQDVTRQINVIEFSQNKLVIDLSNLPTGIYTIRTKSSVERLYKH